MYPVTPKDPVYPVSPKEPVYPVLPNDPVYPVDPVNPRPGTATHAVAAELNLYVFPLVGSTSNWVSVGDPGKLIAIFVLYLSYIYVILL